MCVEDSNTRLNLWILIIVACFLRWRSRTGFCEWMFLNYGYRFAVAMWVVAEKNLEEVVCLLLAFLFV